MAPALYWTFRDNQIPKDDALFLAAAVLEEAGFDDVKTGTSQVSGTKGDVHAFIGVVLRKKSPAPDAHFHTIVFVAAGTGAKGARDDLRTRWEHKWSPNIPGQGPNR